MTTAIVRTVRIVIEVDVEADNDAAAIRAAVETAREGEFDVVAHEVVRVNPIAQ